MAANPPQLAIKVTGPTEDHASNDNDNDPPPSPLSGDTADNLPAGADEEANSTSSSPRPPLYKSSRLKGYITLLITAVYNYAAAASIAPTRLEEIDWCLFVDDLGRFAVQDVENQSRVRFAKSSAMITEIISAIIIIVHLDIFTGLGDNIWNKLFGPNSKVELFISGFLTILWMLTTWFNTSIRGVAGDGKDQFNLYFSTWICCWTSFWTLENWCVASGRASFERFVRSWPNRGPAWIILFILSLSDFFFILDLFRNWPEGTVHYPYVARMYREVRKTEWVLLLFVTSFTFVLALAWTLAEIFRENRTNKGSIKSDAETFVEGIFLHVITVTWVVTVCIVTMPDGSASLLGNAYFTTWGTAFASVGTLVWWLRDWRQSIFEVIHRQQEEYEMVKRAVRNREEKKFAQRMQDAIGESVLTDAAVVDGVACRWLPQCASPRLDMVLEDEGIQEVDDSDNDFDPQESLVNIEMGDEMTDGINDNETTKSDLSTSGQRPRLGTGFSSVTTTTTSPESGVLCFSKSLYVSARSVLQPDAGGSVESNPI